MSGHEVRPLVAVDVGNSRLKLGLFDADRVAGGQLPAPTETLDITPGHGPAEQVWAAQPDPLDAIADWLGESAIAQHAWWIGSVQRAVASRLVNWLRDRGAQRITLLASVDLPLEVALPRPDMVGIDRLFGAVAANHLRAAERAAVIVDLGTAITVDLVSPVGTFQGGAILPGIGLSARALHEFTDLLPLLDLHALAEPPSALGTNTVEAMRSGLYWGAVGGVRQLIELLAGGLPLAPQVFLTGGAAPGVASLLAADARHEPHLVLAGIALAAAAHRPSP